MAFVSSPALLASSCTPEELIILGQHLAEQFPQEGASVQRALRLPENIQHKTLAQVIHGMIAMLLQLHSAKPKPYHTVQRSPTAQMDHALIHTKEALGHVPPKVWEAIAHQRGCTAEEVRRRAWAQMYRGYHRYD